jgi:hypothetical protein
MCGIVFHSRDNRRRFCSKRCGRLFNLRPVLRECPQCGQQFSLRDPRQKFCSRQCANRHKSRVSKGEWGPRWRGGRTVHTGGYIRIWAPHHPRARTLPYVFEHILVMEATLGRYLLAGERVHHRNGQRDDNRAENLELWRVKTKDPAGVRAADYHCPGCRCAELTN